MVLWMGPADTHMTHSVSKSKSHWSPHAHMGSMQPHVGGMGRGALAKDSPRTC